MKKLFILLFLFFFIYGCDTLLIKNVTIQIEESKIITTVTSPNNSYKYFGGITKEELCTEYIERLKKTLNKGKLHLVESNADYVLKIDRIDIMELVIVEYYDNMYWDLSHVNITTEATFNNTQMDIPKKLISKTENSEKLNIYTKKDVLHINIKSFDGINGSIKNNTQELRQKVKTEIKKKY